MVRRVFFSFYYEKDVVRVSQVRNSSITKPDLESAGFIDAADWEKIKEEGDDAIKEWIAENLKNTSVTAVLIGNETSTRDWVLYEIQESYNKNNGMLGIYIHNCPDFNKETCTKGENPFDYVYITENGEEKCLSEIYPTYDWVDDDGYNNLGDWVEDAANDAGRVLKSSESWIHRIKVKFIINGKETSEEYNENQIIRGAVKEVLGKTGNSGQSISNWQLRTEDGTLLYLDKKFKEEGISSGEKLYLSLRAGRGGKQLAF